MEIFGLLVLLAVTALGQNTQVQLFYMVGIIAVACGLAGDVMNNLKAGKILSTSPRVQWNRPSDQWPSRRSGRKRRTLCPS